MNRALEAKLNRYERKRMIRKRWLTIVGSLCAVVALATSIVLINPATAQVQPTYCGYEEHPEHTDDFYEKLLICGYTEGEPSAATEGSGNDVPQPSAESQAAEAGQSGAEAAGHTHGDGWFATENVLTCTDQSVEQIVVCGNADAEHVHTEECYEYRVDRIPDAACKTDNVTFKQWLDKSITGSCRTAQSLFASVPLRKRMHRTIRSGYDAVTAERKRS